MKFFYLANIRMPTEKAHGLQIMQMCEAFASCDATVTLLASRRINSPELARLDPWIYYGVAHSFALRLIWCLDLYPWLESRVSLLAFALQSVPYLWDLLIDLLLHP